MKTEEKKRIETREVVVCDQIGDSIENRIITIRGVQVILDRDLAELYGVKTSRLNEQVKRNIKRFPKRYRFQLTQIETNELIANCDRFESTPCSEKAYGQKELCFNEILEHLQLKIFALPQKHQLLGR